MASHMLNMALDSNGLAGEGDGVSEVEEAEGVSPSFNNLEFMSAGKQNQNVAVGKTDVNGYRSGSAPPTANGSLRAVESLLCSSSQHGDESTVLPSNDYNGFMSENGIRALSTNSYNNDNRTLASIIREENQMVAQRIYDSECESLFSILPGYPFHQPENRSSELNDLHWERLKNPASTRPDQPVNDFARIPNVENGASGDLLQEDHELRINSSAPSSLFHHASQRFSDQIVNVPETAYFGTSAFTGIEPTVREAHGTMSIPNTPDALEYLWRSKTPELQPTSRCSTPNLPLEGSQVYCNASSGTMDISDTGVPLSNIGLLNKDQIHNGTSCQTSSQFGIPSAPDSIWERQVIINMNASEKQVGSIQNINFQRIINGCESNPTIPSINRPATLPDRISYLSDLYSGGKNSGFPSVETSDSYLDSEIQRGDFLGHAGSICNKTLRSGEAMSNDIERIYFQARSQFQSAETQMAQLHKNMAAACGNVHPLRNDFGITSRDFFEFQKAYLEQALRAQQIQQRESYLSNFSNMCQLNPSHSIGLRLRENSMINSMTCPVNGSKNHIFRNRRVSQFRNGTWPPDVAAKSGGRLQTSFLEGMKSSKVHFFGLPDIIGHIVEFSMDQCGSRLIQKKLETASEMDKNLIFPEISLHAGELMTDVFGNYVIQKFLECGTVSQRRELVNQLSGRVLTLSIDKYGCRVIQKALDVVDADQTSKIVTELSGAVIKCVHDHNGNHVIQKCIESIPEHLIQSIITTFFGHVAALSTHPYGCRVIQRVLEYCVDQKTREIVFNEILESVIMLAQNQYGNYVVQRLLLHGKPHEQSAIIRKLVGQVVNMSRQKYASNVIEMCLEHCTPQDRQLLVNEILRSTGEVEPLQVMMQDQYGNYVVQKILKTCTDKDLEPILSRIKVHLKSLKKYTYGKNIVSRIEKLVTTGERRLELSSLYR